MFQVQDVLIPGRFICFILQVLLTISILFGYKDFTLAMNDSDSDTKKTEIRLFVLLGFFLFFEFIEFIILILGYTLFIDLLSLAQIFFHSIAVILLNWLYRDVSDTDLIYISFVLGGIIPFIFEIYNLVVLCQSNRVITKIR